MNKKKYYSLRETAMLLPNKKGGKGISYAYFRNNKKLICKRFGLHSKKIWAKNYFLKKYVDKLWR